MKRSLQNLIFCIWHQASCRQRMFAHHVIQVNLQVSSVRPADYRMFQLSDSIIKTSSNLIFCIWHQASCRQRMFAHHVIQELDNIASINPDTGQYQ
ncbi:unnamed protein product [Rotaria sordida]|uniref:Uncharacterized protein n=1 Tax=Rotaria sordida TaxID=392033 RepID=A0A814P437_9BILA|nr:unnamed protein product [Rotaria sordida]